MTVLGEHGFLPPGHAWEDFGRPLIDSVDAGVEVKRGRQRGLDLHWRPLWNIRDPALGQGYWGSAISAQLHGRIVRIPSPTYQLFCAMARCEPWDRIECFTRVTESYFLLSAAGREVDWRQFGDLTSHYGLECVAAAYLSELRTHAGLAIPASVTDRLARAASAEGTREWTIRAISPGQRTSSQHIALQRQDFTFHRSGRDIRPPGELEEQLRRGAWPRPNMRKLWELARQRIVTCAPSDAPIFIEGFSSPEGLGRWTEGKWAVVVLPLSAAQGQGERLRLNAHVYRGRRSRVMVLAAGGGGVAGQTLRGAKSEAELEVPLRPLAELGGRGLLLLWVPDATVPAEEGNSTDKRQLGLFIRRQWDRDAAGEPPAARFVVLRRLWRNLPLPADVRERMTPILARAVRRITK